MVLIVNTTSDKELSKEFREILEERNTEYEMIEAADMNISPCLGCNFCWLKTPGTCAIKDDYEEILVRAHKVDQLWVITNTALGFMDHKGKNIFDRDYNFFSEECRRFTGPEIYSLPVRIMLDILFKTAFKNTAISLSKKLGCTKPLDYKTLETDEQWTENLAVHQRAV